MSIEKSINEGEIIKSPMAGIFYDGPTCGGVCRNESEPPYVKISSYVNPETVVCEIAAMLVPVPIKAGTSGTIKEKLVNSGQPVNYDQPLFKITPDNKNNSK